MKVADNLDLMGNMLVAARFENLASNPAGAKRGQFWLNTTTMYPSFWDGAAVQQIATVKFVQDSLAGVGSGDMLKSVYDTNNDGKVDRAALADTATNATNADNATTAATASAAPWSGITGKPSTYTPSAHTHTAAQITDLTNAINTQIATYVAGQAGGDTLLDTVGEIITRIQQNTAALTAQIKRFAGTYGDGAATTITVTHNLNTEDLTVSVRDLTTKEHFLTTITSIDANSFSMKFGSAPAANSVRVVVLA